MISFIFQELFRSCHHINRIESLSLIIYRITHFFFCFLYFAHLIHHKWYFRLRIIHRTSSCFCKRHWGRFIISCRLASPHRDAICKRAEAPARQLHNAFLLVRIKSEHCRLTYCWNPFQTDQPVRMVTIPYHGFPYALYFTNPHNHIKHESGYIG